MSSDFFELLSNHFCSSLSLHAFMCKWDKDSKNGDKMSGNNISMESIEKKKNCNFYLYSCTV